MLNDQQFMRYSRQLLLEEIGEIGQQKLLQTKVLIIGLGGLGSPAAHYLATAGIGKLTLVDYDTVHISNLQRQTLYNISDIDKNKALSAKKHLKKINPDCQIEAITTQLSKHELIQQIKQADIALDCTDNMPSRHTINQACIKMNKPFISASAIGFKGQITLFEPPYEHGCYKCLYPDANEITRNCKTAGVVGPVVGMIGTLQALETIKKICNLPSPLSSHLQLFDGINLTWQSLKRTKAQYCPICGGINANNRNR